MVTLVAFHAVLALLLPWALRHDRRAMPYVAALAPLATVIWAVRQSGAVAAGEPIAETVDWAAELGLVLQFRLDGLSWVMLLLVGGVGVLVLVYSAWYFPRPPALIISVLVAFAGAMTGLVLADNLLVLYVFWELTTLCSYLLIAADRPEDPEHRRAANQALLITTGFGLVMLAGFVVLGLAAGTYTISVLLADPPEGAAVTTALVLILLGAFAKSAQMPLHSWLPAAMVAPTPISAYLHAAAMVQAGVYLVGRLTPGFAGTGVWVPLVVTVGLVSLLAAGWQALWQDDLKRLLAYGTISQLGLLMVLVGAGDRTAALAGDALLLAHGLFKAPMFLAVGVLDRTFATRRGSRLHGVGPQLPVTALATALAVASMVGLPPFLGFTAKEAALEAFAHGGADLLVLAGVTVGSAFTVAYGIRFLQAAFGGDADEPTGAELKADTTAVWHALRERARTPRRLGGGPGAPGEAPDEPPSDAPARSRDETPEHPGAGEPPPAAPDRPRDPQRSDGDEPPSPAPFRGEGPERPGAGGGSAPPPDRPRSGVGGLPGEAIWPILVPAVAGLLAGLGPGVWHRVIAPYADQMPTTEPGYTLALWHGLGPLALSVLVLALGTWLYLRAPRLRPLRRRLARLPTAEAGYYACLSGLLLGARELTRRIQVGSLPVYLTVIMLTVLALPGVTLVAGLLNGTGPAWSSGRVRLWDHPMQAVLGVLVVTAALAATRVRRRLSAALLLSATGYGVVGLFVLHGAPDLALTALVVETLTLIILVFVLRRLPEWFPPSRRPLGLRAASTAVSAGIGAFAALFLLVAVLSRTARPVGPRYIQAAAEEDAGNVVNAILVDLRALDTLGEITVLAVAAVGVAALVLTGMEDRTPWPAETGERQPGRWLASPSTPLPGVRPVLLAVTARILIPTILVVSVYLLLAGHAEPGGGFVAGLVAGVAFVLRYLAGGVSELAAAMPLNPGVFIGGGLGLAVGSGAAAWLAGGAFLETTVLRADWPLIGHVELPTSLFFDLGVFGLVLGLVLSLIRTLGTSLEEEPGGRR